jgi:hypothetical protein
MANTLKYAPVAVFWLAIFVSTQTASEKVYPEPDAAEVYRALLAPRSKRPALVLSTTVEPRICSVDEKETKGINDPEFREAMNAFREVNAHQVCTRAGLWIKYDRSKFTFRPLASSLPPLFFLVSG